MEERTLLSAREFCHHHQIEISFLHVLHDYGLIEISEQETDCLLPTDQLPVLEKMVRLHYDLNINLEGIDAICHLLQRVETLQSEVSELRNRVQWHEGE